MVIIYSLNPNHLEFFFMRGQVYRKTLSVYASLLPLSLMIEANS